MMSRKELLRTVILSISMLLGLLSVKFLLLIIPIYVVFLRKTGIDFVLSIKEWICLVMVGIYVVVGLYFSVFRFNSLSFAIDILTIFLFFLVVRQEKQISYQVIKTIGLVLNVLVSIVLFFNVIFYVVHHCNCVYDLGFELLTDFKLVYHPLFMLCNDNATMLLCLLPFLAMMSMVVWKYRLWSIINLSICILSIAFSYSRGAYISMLFFIIVTVLGIIFVCRKKTSQYIVVLMISAMPLVSVVLLSKTFRKSVETTISLFETESQRRSFESRMEKTKMFSTENFVFGNGDGNYFISNLKRKTGYDTLVSASSNNMALQLWEERGIVGYTFVIIIFSLMSVGILMRIKNGSICALFMFVGLCSLILRELSFASFTRISSVFFLGVFMLFVSSFNFQVRNEEA